MNITVGVTDGAWASFLRERREISEVNFWVPSGRDFTGRRHDEPFLFKTKSPANQLIGGGILAGFHELRVSEAWAAFGSGNGVPDEATLLAAIEVYRERNRYDWQPDPTIGCLVLRNVFFAKPGQELPQPGGWSRNLVQGRTYTPADDDHDYVEHAYDVLRGSARLDPIWDRDLVVDIARYGAERLTRARLGQGSFRLAVLDAYGRTCAIAGSRTEPMIDAAHIRAYADGGAHTVSNGLALRADLHRLFDRGYLGIDADHRIRVSQALRTSYGNGVDLYQRQERGDRITLPLQSTDLPDPASLAWHMEHRFIA